MRGLRLPRRLALIGAAAWFLLAGGGGGCAYFNTLYNAKAKFWEAQEIKDRADPERLEITNQEEKLYTESFETAARVVKYWPDSRWVDDALLLMGRSSFEKGEHSAALRKFDEILTFYPDSDLQGEALVNKARTLVETREFGEATVTLDKARELDEKEWREDVIYLSGVVDLEQGDHDRALVAFAEVVDWYEGSEWYSDAGMRAGDYARETGDGALAVTFYDRVRHHGRTPEERTRAGMAMGATLLELGHWKRAEKIFADVAKRAAKEDDESVARLERGRAVALSGDTERAVEIWEGVLKRNPRREGAAGAQLAIARLAEADGDFELAKEQYELVREQGTSHAAWLEASDRMAQIDRVLALREAIASEEEEDKESNRFLLAEQLLEQIGDTFGALDEYESLERDASGTEWGAKALYAQAWVFENRLDHPDSASVLFHRLANYYTGTEVDAYARRRLGYPVWTVEIIEPPRVVFIRGESEDTEPEDVVRKYVAPKNVPLPDGVSSVEVWARLHIADDGSVEKVRIVKSGGDEFDASVEEAALATKYLPPSEGGPKVTVVQYYFPPRNVAPGGNDGEPTIAERDAALEAVGETDAAPSPISTDPGAGTEAGTRTAPQSSLPPGSTPLGAGGGPGVPADSLGAAADSADSADSGGAAEAAPPRRDQPRKLRDRDFDPTTAD